MTKARTTAAKLRAKRNSVDLPDLAPIKRKARGTTRMKELAREQDASIPALEARCRHHQRPATDEDIRHMRAPWNGCNAGKAMSSITPEAARPMLWDAIQQMRRIVQAYDRAIGAPNRHAQSLNLMLPPEPMEADAETPPLDDRSDEDRHRQAVTGWTMLHGWLGHVERHAALVAWQTAIDDAPCLDAQALCRALHCVSDGMAGRKIQYRGA